MLVGGIVGRVHAVQSSPAGSKSTNVSPPRSGITTSPEVPPSYTSAGSRSSDSEESIAFAPRPTSDMSGQREGKIGVTGPIMRQGRRRVPLSTAPRACTPPTLPLTPQNVRRAFRADRVQGRSWSLEGGELVARGVEGEVLGELESGFTNNWGDVDGARGSRGKGRGRDHRRR